MNDQTIICVLGAVSSGKSTYVRSHYKAVNCVLFQPGKVIRDAAGVEWMKTLANPNAPAEIDHLVFALFRPLLRLAGELGRPLVCDAFPRTVAQAIVMKDTCELAGVSCNVDVMVMKPTPSVHQKMMNERGDDAQFDAMRLAKSIQDTGALVGFFQSLQPSPRMRCRVNYVEPK